MKLLATMDAVLRDRQALYERIAAGDGLKAMAGKFLLVFALAAALYGAAMGMFRAIHPEFFFSTYLKVMHLLIFAVAGIFGVRVLWEGLWRLTGRGAFRKIRATALLGAWLILYCFVGGQLAWTLKPFLGTPYLPATPPFRIESGNIYVSFFQSLAKVTRGSRSGSALRD